MTRRVVTCHTERMSESLIKSMNKYQSRLRLVSGGTLSVTVHSDGEILLDVEDGHGGEVTLVPEGDEAVEIASMLSAADRNAFRSRRG